MIDSIVQGDCLEVMRSIPSGSVDLVLTDPPYFKTVNESWDKQWDNPVKFIEWLGLLCEEWYRVLKPNGSLYVFASPQMSARVECKIAERFNVLNSIVWNKPVAPNSELYGFDHLRKFIPITERIIFAEHFGSDTTAKDEAGYISKCNDLRVTIFEPLRAYLDSEWKRAGLTIKDADVCTNTQAASHYFTTSQWHLPSKANYKSLQDYANRNGGAFLERSHESLWTEYEALRTEYEALRRPFNLSSHSPTIDVWNFPIDFSRDNRHPCQKPLGIISHIIKTSSKSGDLVLDCFLGSGTTAVACVQTGRHYIGIEQSEAYCEIARRRVSAAVQQLTLL